MKRLDPKVLLNLSLENQDVGGALIGAKDKKNEAPLLSIDYGEKFSGLAWSPDGICCLAIATIPAEKLMDALKSVMVEKEIKTIILGLPLSQNQKENHICRQIRVLEAKLKKLFSNLKIVLVNERYSSKNTITSRKLKDQSARIDDLAAGQILNFYLSEQ